MDLKELFAKHGQSIWLDFIRRDLLSGGDFARMVREDGIRGVTTNPSIFEKAIDGSEVYQADLAGFRAGATAAEVYEHLALADIQAAADVLMPLYRESGRLDGYVSMEVSPYLAQDAQAMVDEGLRLRREAGRENLMIKVPATPAGLVAIRKLLGHGVNVNVTLLFSRAVCLQVGEAYMDGLEAFAAGGGDPAAIGSVASVFVSRLDTMAAPLLHSAAQAVPENRRAQILGLAGKVALANAKLAYQDWLEQGRGPRWGALAAKGARRQRLLWASTGVKDASLSDVLYVEELVGPDTVDTVPPATLKAFQNHGKAAQRLTADLDAAKQVLAGLADSGIVLDALTERLLQEGLSLFSASFDTLLASINRKRGALSNPR